MDEEGHGDGDHGVDGRVVAVDAAVAVGKLDDAQTLVRPPTSRTLIFLFAICVHLQLLLIHTNWERGLHGTEVAYVLLIQQRRVRFPAFPPELLEIKLSTLLMLITGSG